MQLSMYTSGINFYGRYQMFSRVFTISMMFLTIGFFSVVVASVQGIISLDAGWTTTFFLLMVGSFLAGMVMCVLVPDVFESKRV